MKSLSRIAFALLVVCPTMALEAGAGSSSELKLAQMSKDEVTGLLKGAGSGDGGSGLSQPTGPSADMLEFNPTSDMIKAMGAVGAATSTELIGEPTPKKLIAVLAKNGVKGKVTAANATHQYLKIKAGGVDAYVIFTKHKGEWIVMRYSMAVILQSKHMRLATAEAINDFNKDHFLHSVYKSTWNGKTTLVLRTDHWVAGGVTEANVMRYYNLFLGSVNAYAKAFFSS